MKLSEIYKDGVIDPKIKVRHLNCPEGMYFSLYFKDRYGYYFGLDNENSWQAHDGVNDRWEIYTEPKPVVKRAKYIFRLKDDSGYSDTDFYYIDDDEFLSDFPYATWFRRLQEIECPE